MDSNYIINRLRTTLYKYPTVGLLQTRLRNLDDAKREEVVSKLKVALHKHTNVDIHEPLFKLLYHAPMAS